MVRISTHKKSKYNFISRKPYRWHKIIASQWETAVSKYLNPRLSQKTYMLFLSRYWKKRNSLSKFPTMLQILSGLFKYLLRKYDWKNWLEICCNYFKLGGGLLSVPRFSSFFSLLLNHDVIELLSIFCADESFSGKRKVWT